MQTLNWRSTGIDVFIGEAMTEVRKQARDVCTRCLCKSTNGPRTSTNGPQNLTKHERTDPNERSGSTGIETARAKPWALRVWSTVQTRLLSIGIRVTAYVILLDVTKRWRDETHASDGDTSSTVHRPVDRRLRKDAAIGKVACRETLCGRC